MSKMYDNLISTAVNSINIVENTVIITYNSNKDKEYTFTATNPSLFEEQFAEELLKVSMNDGGSIGKFMFQQIRDGFLTENK